MRTRETTKTYSRVYNVLAEHPVEITRDPLRHRYPSTNHGLTIAGLPLADIKDVLDSAQVPYYSLRENRDGSTYLIA